MAAGTANALTSGQGGPLAATTQYGPYGSIISQASSQYGIPQPVIWGMIQQESQGQPNIEGQLVTHKSGLKEKAQGLMQIMPSTFTNPGYPGMEPGDMSMIKDPKTNIMFGTQYLAATGRHLFGDDWDPKNIGQMRTALAMYSGGAHDYADYVFRKGGVDAGGVTTGAPIPLHPNVSGGGGAVNALSPTGRDVNAIIAGMNEARRPGTPEYTAANLGAESGTSQTQNGLGGRTGGLTRDEAAKMQPPGSAIDIRKMIQMQTAMAMLQRLLPQGMKFEPISYNPMRVLERTPQLGGRAPAIPLQPSYPALQGVSPYPTRYLSPASVPTLGRRGQSE
jgi:hypothetical protein